MLFGRKYLVRTILRAKEEGRRGSEVVVGGDVTSVETKGDRREGEQRGVDKIARVVNR